MATNTPGQITESRIDEVSLVFQGADQDSEIVVLTKSVIEDPAVCEDCGNSPCTCDSEEGDSMDESAEMDKKCSTDKSCGTQMDKECGPDNESAEMDKGCKVKKAYEDLLAVAPAEWPEEIQKGLTDAVLSLYSDAVLEKSDQVDLTPSDEMARVAEQALKWRDEFNRGGTAVGVARARDISNKKTLSESTLRRMSSYFARHAVDSKATGFSSGEDGFPSAGRIAWDLWGGDPGRSWVERKLSQLDRESLRKEYPDDSLLDAFEESLQKIDDSFSGIEKRIAAIEVQIEKAASVQSVEANLSDDEILAKASEIEAARKQAAKPAVVQKSVDPRLLAQIDTLRSSVEKLNDRVLREMGGSANH